MSQDSGHSEKVIEEYKKRKLAVSAYYRIQDLVKGFDQDRADDTRMALFGVGMILVLIVIAILFFMTGESVTLF